MRRVPALLALCFSTASCNLDSIQFPFLGHTHYNANDPIQDRVTYAQLTSIPGFTISVFDGHGGPAMAEFASKHINAYLDSRIKENFNHNITNEQRMEKSLGEAYNDVEEAFFAIFKENVHTKEYRRAGACALTAIILKNSIHVGNAGDCEGVLLGPKKFEKTNTRLNAGEPQEMARLKKEFPNEEDIVKCHEGTNFCYVKGRLQPTRSFGDFYLKRADYNLTKLKTFTGPYITHKPIVTHFNSTSEQKFLLLGSDGLWDELKAEEIHRTSLRSKTAQALVSNILQDAMLKITQSKKIQFEELDKIRDRRHIHDDISIIAVDIDKIRQTL